MGKRGKFFLLHFLRILTKARKNNNLGQGEEGGGWQKTEALPLS